MSMINEKNRWWMQGLFFGVFMYIFNVIFEPMSENQPLTTKHLLIGIPIWLFSGLLFGLIMKAISPTKKPD